MASHDLYTSAFDTSATAQIVVEATGRVSAINAAARATFGLRANDVGELLQDLEISRHPIELRSLIERALDERRQTKLKDVPFAPAGGKLRTFDVQLGLLTDTGDGVLGVNVSFTDVSRYRQLHDELDAMRRDLETAYAELRSTTEELETTSGELQSANEELETANEELQSANRALETMNTELQSTSDDLEAMSDELRDRTDEAVNANALLGSVLFCIEQAVVVVDDQLRLTAWSNAAAELWGLPEEEVHGEHLLNLDIGLPVGELRTPLRAALAGIPQPTLTLEGHNRCGQPIVCEVSLARLCDHLGAGNGVILVMSAQLRPAFNPARPGKQEGS